MNTAFNQTPRSDKSTTCDWLPERVRLRYVVLCCAMFLHLSDVGIVTFIRQRLEDIESAT